MNPFSGGLHPEIMHNLVAKTDGYCSFSTNVLHKRIFLKYIGGKIENQLKLDYSYLTEDTILIRINFETPTDHWLPYQD
ncbi:hypothetical protein L3Y34_016424 [Caenorhabditis briggsae]|uniref:Uncharacterized protein n=1 Tax=Caenorhabditis briggsae TaxID=6238 RepID=A0AAE9J0A7_CAEBR|nr:hypothetical protein L3Y34_016424 [Caenorhabditis briggsae]